MKHKLFNISNENQNLIRVVHGANVGYFVIAGSKVSHIAHALKDIFNIPSDATASVKGREVGSNYILKNNDNLEFSKLTGRKGGLQEYWSEPEIIELCGLNALEEIKKAGFKTQNPDVFSLEDIKSWIRRQNKNKKENTDKYGLFVDPTKFEITYKDQGTLPLGNNLPFHLIARLSKCPNIFIDFETLKLDVWKDDRTNDYYTDDKTISRAVRNLRKKLVDFGFTDITLDTDKNNARLILS